MTAPDVFPDRTERLGIMLTASPGMLDYVTDAELTALWKVRACLVEMDTMQAHATFFLAWRHLFNAMGCGPETRSR